MSFKITLIIKNNTILNFFLISISIKKEIYELLVPPDAGDLLAWLYREGEVLARLEQEDGSLQIQLRLPHEKAAHLSRRAPQARKLS